MATVSDVINYLRSNAAKVQVFHQPPGASASEVAEAHGITPGEVATVGLYRVDRRYVITIVPAGWGVDVELLKDLLQAKELKRASGWDRVRLFPGCEIRAIPPFGNLYGLQVVADSGFEQAGSLAFRACVCTASIRMEWNDYKRLVNPIVAPIAEARMIQEPAEEVEE